jgi:hypothetical protein
MELTEEQIKSLKKLKEKFSKELQPIPENGGYYQGAIISAEYAKELDKAIEEKILKYCKENER